MQSKAKRFAGITANAARFIGISRLRAGFIPNARRSAITGRPSTDTIPPGWPPFFSRFSQTFRKRNGTVYSVSIGFAETPHQHPGKAGPGRVTRKARGGILLPLAFPFYRWLTGDRHAGGVDSGAFSLSGWGTGKAWNPYKSSRSDGRGMAGRPRRLLSPNCGVVIKLGNGSPPASPGPPSVNSAMSSSFKAG